MTNLRLRWWKPALCSLIFFLCGIALISYPGLQNDEALAASPLFRIVDAIDHVSIFGRDIPTMLMAYVGALKTWIYAIVFHLFAPSYISIRVPAVIFGSATVWIFFVLMVKIHSEPAAWAAALILATDPMFILTSTFDWGPVALQHLLAVSGIFFLIRFHQLEGRRFLAYSFFCFGLGFWDKALFAWIFGGLVVAAVILYPRDVFRALSVRNVGVATLAFCLGAAPLIAFNVTNEFKTFHSTSGFSTHEIVPKKTAELVATFDGSALFGFLAADDNVPNSRAPANLLERCSFALHSLSGTRHHDGLLLLSLACLFVLPFLWRTSAFRTGAFCVLALVVSWIQMAITRDAGGAAHHVVLLWPLPMIVAGVVLAESAHQLGKIGHLLAVFALTAFVALNLLVGNQYLYQLARNGSPGSWSDAIYPLAKSLREAHASRIGVLDWGMVLSLDVLDRGRLPLVWSYDVPARGDTSMLQDGQLLWLSHTDGNEQFAGTNARFATFVEKNGFRKTSATLYYDRNGRPIFQTFRVVPSFRTQ